MATTSDDFKDFCRDEYPQLVGSLRLACSGDRHLAEDLAQEALTRPLPRLDESLVRVGAACVAVQGRDEPRSLELASQHSTTPY